jgi:hypothetical protein
MRTQAGRGGERAERRAHPGRGGLGRLAVGGDEHGRWRRDRPTRVPARHVAVGDLPSQHRPTEDAADRRARGHQQRRDHDDHAVAALW